jgi:hypothetical protein
MSRYKLYVWNNVLDDWTGGIAVAAAEDEEQARELILLECRRGKDEGNGFEQLYRDLNRPADEVLALPAAAYCWGGA